MYGIRFTVEYNDVSFENFSLTYDAYLDFSGSGVLTFNGFDKLLEEELLDKEEFVDLLMEDYFRDLDTYENTVHLNQDDVDFVYNEYVKQYRDEWH